jgi:hypothetical protein
LRLGFGVDSLRPWNRRELKSSSPENGLSPTKGSEARFLIGKCLTIRCFRIDNSPKRRFTVFYQVMIVWILA